MTDQPNITTIERAKAALWVLQKARQRLEHEHHHGGSSIRAMDGQFEARNQFLELAPPILAAFIQETKDRERENKGLRVALRALASEAKLMSRIKNGVYRHQRADEIIAKATGLLLAGTQPGQEEEVDE